MVDFAQSFFFGRMVNITIVVLVGILDLKQSPPDLMQQLFVNMPSLQFGYLF